MNENDRKQINDLLVDCDKRIAGLQKPLDELIHLKKVAGFVYVPFRPSGKKTDRSGMMDAVPQQILKTTNAISILKTEKLIYKAIINPTTNKDIFPRLLAKFDELVGESYDMLKDMVRSGDTTEGEYLDYCNKSLDMRECMKDICERTIRILA